jgi:hypothetical protein
MKSVPKGMFYSDFCAFGLYLSFQFCQKMLTLSYFYLMFTVSAHEYCGGFHYDIFRGKVNLKSLPFPSSLSTQIFPPSFSTNSLQRSNPKPEPFSLAVPVVV